MLLDQALFCYLAVLIWTFMLIFFIDFLTSMTKE